MNFLSELLFFCKSLMLLFFTEGFAHGRSFVMSDLSELLMVARAISSQSLFLNRDESKLLTAAQ